jgi:putative membrane protein
VPDLVTAAVALAALLALGGYLVGAEVAGGWPWWRSGLWAGGVAAGLAGFSSPAHMAGHLLTGMVAPLLLMLAAPGTLALRALPVGRARRLTRLLRTPVVRVLTHPVYAAGVGAVTVWLLYGTPAGRALLHGGQWHAVLHGHLVASGFLLAWSVAGRDPAPHRPGPPVRAVALGVYMAAHGILAKRLYTSAPDDALLMYYGGDLTHLVLVVLICHDWYRAAGQRGQAGRPVSAPSRNSAIRSNAPAAAFCSERPSVSSAVTASSRSPGESRTSLSAPRRSRS